MNNVIKMDRGFIKYDEVLTDDTCIIHLHNVWVDEHFRNQGIGTKMMTSFIDSMNHKYESFVILGHVLYEKPLNFYKRLEFDVNPTIDEIYEIEYAKTKE